MAINTEDRRRSAAAGLEDWEFPFPDASLDLIDRQHTAGIYIGIPVLPEAVGTITTRQKRRSAGYYLYDMELPRPDGFIHPADRQHATWVYAGIPVQIIGPQPAALKRHRDLRPVVTPPSIGVT
jgi:hypothetical protein